MLDKNNKNYLDARMDHVFLSYASVDDYISLLVVILLCVYDSIFLCYMYLCQVGVHVLQHFHRTADMLLLFYCGSRYIYCQLQLHIIGVRGKTGTIKK